MNRWAAGRPAAPTAKAGIMSDGGNSDGGNALGRWSRLKEEQRTSKRRGGAAPKLEEAALAPGHEPVPLDPVPDDGPAADATGAPPPDLPPIEELKQDSDYSVFMREGVPEELRRLALRKLWRSNPIFGIRDGLDDYDEDYTMIGMVVEKITSVFDAEKGMPDLAKEEAEAKAKKAKAAKKRKAARAAKKQAEEKSEAQTAGTAADTDDDDLGDGEDEMA